VPYILSAIAKTSLMVGLAAAFLATPFGRSAGTPTLRVQSDAQLEAAVSALRDSGGTIVLLPHSYGELVVPARSSAQLRIVGKPGVYVERVLFNGAQHASLGRLTIAPRAQDAWIEVRASAHIDLHDLLVTAQGTRYSASVWVPDSTDVTVRNSTFTHCGDRSPSWTNCLRLSRWVRRVTVEDNWFHDCFGCDFIHGRFASDLTIRRNRLERALPCRINPIRCGHQDLIELFLGQGLQVVRNHFGLYERGGAQLYLTNAIDHVRIANNVFLGKDPRLPGHHALVGLIVGSSGSRRLPHDVVIANNTILTGARRPDGYGGSLRMASRYGAVPRRQRPVLANNVIGWLASTWPVCNAVRSSVSNVVLRGRPCSPSDRVGDAKLDARGRPTAASTLLIGRASRRYAPRIDATGRRRGARADIGAYEYRG
jgi:hypothetical protein